MSAVISETEFNERVAILKRLRELLQKQRDKFQAYLETLENQEKTIAGESVDALNAQTAIEEDLLAEILVVQKSIAPLEKLYEKLAPDEDIPRLKTDLTQLREKVMVQKPKK